MCQWAVYGPSFVRPFKFRGLALSLLENILHSLIYKTVELIKKSLVKKVSFIIIAKYFLVWLVGFTFKMMYVCWLFSQAVE